MLRNPVERVVSNYYYVRKTPEHRLHKHVSKNSISLKKYVESEINESLDNQAVRHLVEGYKKVKKNGSSKRVLGRAKKNLSNHFGVAGIAERFDESVLLMKQHYGWKSVVYRKRNVTSERPSREELPKETISLIKEKNRLDLQLYRFVSEEIEERISETELKSELHWHRIKCRVYDLIKEAYDTGKNTLHI